MFGGRRHRSAVVKFDAQKALIAYSGVLTALMVGVLVSGAAPDRSAEFSQIDVQRINVREPDGTLRMVISNQASFPGIPVRGREYPHPNRRTAGMLFMNDEGTETGGLIWSGGETNGVRHSTGSLTFDRYEQDQVVQLFEDEMGGARSSGVRVFDRPDGSMGFDQLERIGALPAEQQAAAYAEAGFGGKPRGFFGRQSDGASAVVLRDGEGRPRLRMTVTADGAAKIDFLDETGQVSRTLTPED
jgi:hypothetical protein